MSKKLIVLSVLSLLSLSCDRAVKNSSSGKVVITIPNSSLGEKVVSDVATFSAGLPPISWNDADCFGFLVSGPEDSMRINKCQKLNGVTGEIDGEISYGKIYAGFYKDESIELEVPSGSARVITALAFKSNIPLATTSAAACKSMLQQENQNFSKGFVYATSASFNIQSGTTQTVSLPISYIYNSSPFVGDCEGPDAPGKGNGTVPAGPPAKLRMRFQNNLTSLNASSCVAVIFELLDANGNKPTVNENYSFTVRESSYNSEFFMIDGTYCTPTAGPTTQTIPFFNENNKLTSITLFMKPVNSGNFNFIFTQSTGASLPIEAPVNLPVYNHGIPSSEGPFKISVFDIHTFKSSSESLVSNPIKVQPDQCHPAVVQILDKEGRPVKIYNSASGNSYDSLVTVLNLFGVGVSSNAACPTLQSTHPFSLSGLAYDYFLNRFYYKVPSGNSGRYFSVKTQNTGAGFYHGSFTTEQLDPTAAVNNNSFWKIE